MMLKDMVMANFPDIVSDVTTLPKAAKQKGVKLLLKNSLKLFGKSGANLDLRGKELIGRMQLQQQEIHQ